MCARGAALPGLRTGRLVPEHQPRPRVASPKKRRAARSRSRDKGAGKAWNEAKAALSGREATEFEYKAWN